MRCCMHPIIRTSRTTTNNEKTSSTNRSVTFWPELSNGVPKQDRSLNGSRRTSPRRTPPRKHQAYKTSKQRFHQPSLFDCAGAFKFFFVRGTSEGRRHTAFRASLNHRRHGGPAKRASPFYKYALRARRPPFIWCLYQRSWRPPAVTVSIGQKQHVPKTVWHL